MSQNKILDRQFFHAGAIIIRQGTTGNRAFLIESGKVEVFAEQEDGSTVHLAELGPQSIIGEMAAIADTPRSASVRAIDDTVLVAVESRQVKGSMNKSDNLFKRLTGIATDRLRDTQDKLSAESTDLPDAGNDHSTDAADHPDSLSHIMRLTQRHVPAGTVIITEGSLTTDVFLVERGRVEVFTNDAAGHEIIIKELGPHSVVGEMAALTRKPRNASVRTLDDCDLLVVTADDLEAGMEKSPSLRQNLLHILTTRLNDIRLRRKDDDEDFPDSH